MKRTVFYVWYATAEENQNGTHHRSDALATEAEARAESSKQWARNDFVSVDKVREVYDHHAWRQEDGTETECIEIE